MKKIAIIGAVAVLVLGTVLFVFKGSNEQQVSKLDVTDTVGNFYNQWLEATHQPLTADPNRATLAKSPILSEVLRTRLKNYDTKPDPVLCQTVTPENISLMNVSENEDKAQVLVISKDRKVTEQALVTLLRYGEGWYINDILCSPGEFEPEREFSFEKEGYLLKGSIPPPFNPVNWHLVFEENGKLGNVVPLFFDSKSQCTSLDGNKSVCKPDQFTEATKVSVHGQMTERGVSVNQQQFVK
ncbi:MAG: hypothetical protein WD896_02155 [Parcubacteria group bacterium]